MLKKTAITLLISASLVATGASAGVPVVDAGSIAQAVIQVQQLKDQITNQITQIKSLQSQYAALTGSRNLGDLFNNPALRNYLPTDYANLYDAVKKGNAGQIGQAISGLQQQEANYAKTSAAERMALENLTHKAASIAALQAQSARLDNIQNLMSQINYATDAKAASDLQNRISAETAMVQAEQNRLNLMAQLHQANVQLAEEQRITQSKSRLLYGKK